MPEKVTTDDRLIATQQQIAALLQAQIENQPPRHLSYPEWEAKQPKRVMPVQFYMNGYRVGKDALTDEQLALLPKLQSGRFYNRRIHVYRDASADRGWHLDYPNSSSTNRIAISKYGRDLTEILQKVTTETPDLT